MTFTIVEILANMILQKLFCTHEDNETTRSYILYINRTVNNATTFYMCPTFTAGWSTTTWLKSGLPSLSPSSTPSWYCSCCIRGWLANCSLLVNSLDTGRHLLGMVSISVGLEWVRRGLNILESTPAHCRANQDFSGRCTELCLLVRLALPPVELVSPPSSNRKGWSGKFWVVSFH